MINRRRLMFTAAAGAGLAACGQALAQTPAAAASASAALTALMGAIVQSFLLESPETLTSLGMDKGPMAAMKSRLDDRSQAKIDADRVVFHGQMDQPRPKGSITMPCASSARPRSWANGSRTGTARPIRSRS
jgi:ABC-type glycerol-3-phosphate transport system substrate-binding protein